MYQPLIDLAIWVVLAVLVVLLGVLWRRERAYRELLNRQRRISQDLEANLSLLQTTLDSTLDGLLLVDSRRQPVACNQRMLDLLNISIEQLADGDLPRRFDTLASRFRNGSQVKVRLSEMAASLTESSSDVFETVDGTFIEAMSQPRFVNGTIDGRVWTCRDVTRSHRLEGELRQSEEYLRAILHHMGDPVICCRLDGAITFASHACRELGYVPEHLLGLNAFDLLHRDDLAMARRNFRSPVVGRASSPVALRVLHAQGHYVEMELGGRVVRRDRSDRYLVIVGRSLADRRQADLTLRDQLHLLQVLVNAIPQPIFFTDDETIFIGCNDAAEELLGLTKREIIGRRLVDLPPRAAVWFDPPSDLRTARDARYHTREVTDANGVVHHLIVTSAPFGGHPGSPGGKVISFLDVTDVWKARQAVRESELAMRTIFDSVHDGIFVHGANGVILEVNATARRMFDFTREEARRLSIVPDLSDPESPIDQLPDIWRNVLQGENHLFEWKPRRPSDGTCFDAEVFLTRIVYHGQTAVMAMVRDITSRKQDQKALREALVKLQAVVNASPLGIVAHDASGLITLWNAAAERMYGWKADEMLGRPNPLANEVKQSEFRSLQARVLRGPVQTGVEISHRRSDGSAIDICLSTAPLRDADGSLQGLVSVLTDISEQKRSERALRESEGKYRMLVESISDVIYTYDLTGHIRYVSPNVEQLSGHTVDEVVGRHFLDFVHPDDHQIAVDGFEASVDGHRSGPTSCRLVVKSGAAIHVEEQSRLVKDDPTGTVYGVGVIRNMTARVRDQEQIRKLSLAVEQCPVSVVITDLAGNIEYVNARFTELTGYSRAEVLGNNPRVLKSGLMSDDVYRDLWATISKGGQWQGVLHNRRKNGELYWELASIRGITDTSGRITHYLALKEDITERLAAERELRKLSTAMVQSANLISVISTSGVIEFVNPRFSEVTGYTLAEVVARPFTILHAMDNDDESIAAIWEAIRGGSMWSGRLRSRRKNGEVFWEYLSLAPVRDETGGLMNFVLIGEDVTAEVLAQQKIQESDKMAAIGTLAAGVSHEFKNYLGGIIGNASYALDALPPDGGPDMALARETLAQIIDLGEKANQIAMSLLSYSRSGSQDFVRTSLHAIVTNTLSLVEKDLLGRGIELMSYLPPIPEVDVSPSKIQQLLLNLLINARDAISDAGVVSVTLGCDQQWVELKVIDTGAGIPSRNLSRIFDPFFSTKGVWGKDGKSGAGMGLPICRNIAHEHRGDIEVTSVVGAGTTFTVRLPLPEITAVHSPDERRRRTTRILLFSADRKLYQDCLPQTCAANIDLYLLDDVFRLEDDLRRLADLVVCDARFSGKIELLKVVEVCRQFRVPYAMVRCGALEYQLSHLYDHASANFREFPDLDRLLALVDRADAGHATATLPSDSV